jgi:lambda repressor-like predicted transcriptional regulator
MDLNRVPWTELIDALNERGLLLVDISRESKLRKHRTIYSKQYLTDLKNGRRDNGLTGIPNVRVIHAIARALQVHPAVLTPKRHLDYLEAIAS